jgi:hypothetical protein
MVASSQIGSGEFAAERFGTPLVVVGSLAMRSCSCHVGRTLEAEEEAVKESSIDRGPDSPILALVKSR